MPWIISHPTLPLPRLVLITFGYIFLAEYKWSVVWELYLEPGTLPPQLFSQQNKTEKEIDIFGIY